MPEQTINFAELEPVTWSSEDELEFVRYLYNHKNLAGLVNYRRLLPYRNFYGAGMYVDQRLLRMSLDTHIDALEADLLR